MELEWEEMGAREYEDEEDSGGDKDSIFLRSMTQYYHLVQGMCFFKVRRVKGSEGYSIVARNCLKPVFRTPISRGTAHFQ